MLFVASVALIVTLRRTVLRLLVVVHLQISIVNTVISWPNSPVTGPKALHLAGWSRPAPQVLQPYPIPATPVVPPVPAAIQTPLVPRMFLLGLLDHQVRCHGASPHYQLCRFHPSVLPQRAFLVLLAFLNHLLAFHTCPFTARLHLSWDMLHLSWYVLVHTFF